MIALEKRTEPGLDRLDPSLTKELLMWEIRRYTQHLQNSQKKTKTSRSRKWLFSRRVCTLIIVYEYSGLPHPQYRYVIRQYPYIKVSNAIADGDKLSSSNRQAGTGPRSLATGFQGISGCLRLGLYHITHPLNFEISRNSLM